MEDIVRRVFAVAVATVVARASMGVRVIVVTVIDGGRRPVIQMVVMRDVRAV